MVAESRVLVLVNGVPGSGKSTLARALASATGLPLVSKDALKTFLAGAFVHAPDPVELSRLAGRLLWDVVSAMPSGAIVETWFGPTGREAVEAGYLRAGIHPEQVTEVWCEVPVEVARARFFVRLDSVDRPSHLDTVGRDESYWRDLETAQPLGMLPVVRVKTDQTPDPQIIADLAVQVLGSRPGKPPRSAVLHRPSLSDQAF